MTRPKGGAPHPKGASGYAPFKPKKEAQMEDHVKQALEIVKAGGEINIPQLTVVIRELFNLRLREAEEVARKIKDFREQGGRLCQK